MEDFDVFTNEINFTQPLCKNILNKYVNEVPTTPNGANYQSGRKLQAEECLAACDEIGCAFQLSEAASATLRTMAVYRDEQLKAAGELVHKITSYIKPVKEMLDANPLSKEDKKILDLFPDSTNLPVLDSLNKDAEKLEFHEQYLRFSKDNNVDNFKRILTEIPKGIPTGSNCIILFLSWIVHFTLYQFMKSIEAWENSLLKEKFGLKKDIDILFVNGHPVFANNRPVLPSVVFLGALSTTLAASTRVAAEWTVIQLTAPYNPNENLTSLNEYRTQVQSLYLTMFTNDYIDAPVSIHIPANVTKEGEQPLFTELYSLLDENYKTIDNAQFLNNKRLVLNYWSRREDIDLRMKSVINVMDKEWLGGWSSLLTGKIVDKSLKDKVVTIVDSTIQDWGFIRLTQKQKVLLYNLMESCPVLHSTQIKSCIRRILTEHGNPDDIRQVLQQCDQCKKDFRFTNELCLKCLGSCFEKIHHFSLVDGIRAFSQAAMLVKENDDWAGLRKAKRHPVILIVDEILDTFPWEMLPVLNPHPVSRMENIHFLYYLYKIHQDKVIDGYFESKCDVGRYVINPENNLDRMESRMTSFVRYWCGTWTGYVGEAPPSDTYIDYLTHADVFLYCGHGDGCQLAGGWGSLSSRGSAVCIVSGCGSVRLGTSAPREPYTAAHHHLHIAGCPMVVGMLWEVTDLEVDKVVSTLLSLFVPSEAEVSWNNVGKSKWSQGQLDTTVEQKSQFTPEPDLLRAISRSRSSSNYVMIASSVVARGLPVRIRS